MHAYAECTDVRGLWDLVLDRWEVATSERLYPQDRRVTLLGDRGEMDLATSREMWRLVHAATVWVVHRTDPARTGTLATVARLGRAPRMQC